LKTKIEVVARRFFSVTTQYTNALDVLLQKKRKPLKPRTQQAAGAAPEPKVIGAVGEVKGVNLGRAKVLEVVERGEFGGGLTWSEEEPERLASLVNASDQGVVGELFEQGERRSGLPIIKDQTAPGRLGSDETQGRTKRFKSEIRDNAKPREERWSG
jgi:hypothetical protein